jgi:hypothetical protein
MNAFAIGDLIGGVLMMMAVAYIAGYVTFKISKNKRASVAVALLVSGLVAYGTAAGSPGTSAMNWIGWVVGVALAVFFLNRLQPKADEKAATNK